MRSYRVTVSRAALSALLALCVAFVAALAPLLLGEKMERGHWPLVLTALAGVALIVGPSGELRRGALIGVSGSMLSGLAYMTIRDLAKTEHPLTILVWSAVTLFSNVERAILAARAHRDLWRQLQRRRSSLSLHGRERPASGAHRGGCRDSGARGQRCQHRRRQGRGGWAALPLSRRLQS